jgi:hypothetical protein
MSKNYVAGKVAKKRRGLSCISILLLGTVLLAPRLSMAERSVYTSLEKKCRTTTYQEQPATECPGIWGWRLLVVYEAERSYLVLKKQGYVKSLRDEIFSEEIGQFPEIPAATRAEWRLGSQGRSRALIFRVYAVDPKKSLQEDPNPYKSSLLVVRLGEVACVLGVVKDNKRARLLADSNAACNP